MAHTTWENAGAGVAGREGVYEKQFPGFFVRYAVLTFRYKIPIPIGQLTNRFLRLFKGAIFLSPEYIVFFPVRGVGEDIVDAAVHVAFYV